MRCGMSVLKLSFSLLFAFASLFFAARPVSAASFDTTTRVWVDGDMKTPAGKLFINKNQCTGTASKPSAKIRIELSNLSASHGSASLLEFWTGQADNSNQNCHAAAGRKPEASTQGKTPCVRVPVPDVRNIDPRKQELEFTAADLFTDTRSDGDAKCNLQGTIVLFVVPLPSETTDTSQADGIGNPIKITFDADFVAMNAPASVRAGSGESNVTVRWNSVGSTDPLMNYGVYFDTGAVQPAGGSCTSELLIAGKELDIFDKALKHRTTKGTSQDVDPADYGLDIGEQIPTAVLTFDAAGNASVVSNVVCVQRVATDGFWDICSSDKNCSDDFDTCSVSQGVGRGPNGFIAGTLTLLGLALWVRRRRTV